MKIKNNCRVWRKQKFWFRHDCILSIQVISDLWKNCWIPSDLDSEFVTLLVCWSATSYHHLSALVILFSARCNIYAYAMMSVSVCLSVTEVHWCIIANLGFQFRSKFTAHCVEGSSPGRVEGSSRAMLATARSSCFFLVLAYPGSPG